MDATIILIIALFVGVAIIGFVVKALLYKGYDKARNSYIRRKNAANPPPSMNLSDMYDKNDF